MKQNDCERALAITEALDAGASLPDAERAWLAQHQSVCARCYVEAKVVATLALAVGDDDHFPADALSDRRQVQQVVTAFQEDVAQASSRAPALLAWRWLLGGGLAAASAAVVLMVWAPWSGSLTPQLLLMAASQDRAVFAPAEGQTLTTDREELAVALGERARLLVAPQTTVQLAKLHGGVELELLRGRLHLDVNPSGNHVPVAVVTDDGRMEVKGTIFEVAASDAGVDLRVLRGVVEVQRPGRPAQRVSQQHLNLRRSAPPESLPEADAERLRTMSRRLHLLGAAEDARLSINSTPSGASVRLNGEFLGSTPLFARVKPGVVALEVSAPGVTSVAEQLEVKAGTGVMRSYLLQAPVKLAAVPPADFNDDLEASTSATREPQAHTRRATKPSKPSELLLEEAQVAREAQAWRKAADSYRTLVNRYPDEPLAHVASVSLADLLLEHLHKPREALQLCSAYLNKNPNGAVAEEASLCEIRALKALGRARDEAASIRQFVARFRDSSHAATLRARLGELEAADKR